MKNTTILELKGSLELFLVEIQMNTLFAPVLMNMGLEENSLILTKILKNYIMKYLGGNLTEKMLDFIMKLLKCTVEQQKDIISTKN